METKISLAFVIAVIVALVVLALALVGMAIGLAGGEPGIGFGCLAAGLVWVLVTAGFCWPWDMQYHRWTETRGVVASSYSRVLSTADGPSEMFVVKFSDGRTRRCDDSRCAPLKPGDKLTLWCMRQWQWAGDPGWNCNFGQVRP